MVVVVVGELLMSILVSFPCSFIEVWSGRLYPFGTGAEGLSARYCTITSSSSAIFSACSLVSSSGP